MILMGVRDCPTQYHSGRNPKRRPHDRTRTLDAGSRCADRADDIERAEGALFFSQLGTPAAKEAMTAFLEKRTPDFSKYD